MRLELLLASLLKGKSQTVELPKFPAYIGEAGTNKSVVKFCQGFPFPACIEEAGTGCLMRRR